MRKTYIFRGYITLPLIFTEQVIPQISNRDEVRIEELAPETLLVDTIFINSNHVRYFRTESYKSISLWERILIRNPQWEYVRHELFKQNTLRFFLFPNENQCFIDATLEAYEQLRKQSNHTLQDRDYMQFSEQELNLNDLIARFPNNCIRWLWINIAWNPMLSNIRLKGGQCVNDSPEAREALNQGWIIEYIQFVFQDYTIKVYKDFRFSFYTNVSIEDDITLLKEVITHFRLI